MINPKAMKSLFKPYNIKKEKFDFLALTGVDEKKFWKINFEQECSKATDESCINFECPYNYLNMHNDELYIDLMQEIQHERKELEKRIERDRKRHGFI